MVGGGRDAVLYGSQHASRRLCSLHSWGSRRPLFILQSSLGAVEECVQDGKALLLVTYASLLDSLHAGPISLLRGPATLLDGIELDSSSLLTPVRDGIPSARPRQTAPQVQGSSQVCKLESCRTHARSLLAAALNCSLSLPCVLTAALNCRNSSSQSLKMQCMRAMALAKAAPASVASPTSVPS